MLVSVLLSAFGTPFKIANYHPRHVIDSWSHRYSEPVLACGGMHLIPGGST